MNQKTLLCLVGPTASGKTAVGIGLAERLGGEIISADARQVYRRLDIGTAKPTADELARATHHCIDVAGPEEIYHAGRFVKEAEAALVEIDRRGHRPIVVGGTGLYVRALVQGLQVPVGRDPKFRARMAKRIARMGSAALHAELERIDPASAAAIHRNDQVRIVRALEIHHLTGEPKSALERPVDEPRHPYRLAALDLPREILYRRIDERFDRMMAAGFLEEVRALLASGLDPDLPCFRSPGYREMIAHLAGELPLAEAVEKAKRESRRYAKRQFTWFRSEKEIRWFEGSPPGGAEEVAESIAAWDRSAS